MFRNREVQRFLFIKGLISLIAIISGFLMSARAGWLMLLTILLLVISTYIFTMWRYREIAKLSSYLREIASGHYSLDVRDNHEGELSILKSEIFKVTNILSKHAAKLEGNKVQLTNAISDISHQLKTPLTSMMVMADLLDNPDLPTEKRLEFTSNIHGQLQRLNGLVSSLLKLSKIDSGTVAFKKEPIIVADLIEQSLQFFMILLDVKQQKVTIQGKNSMVFMGDFYWTKEALINILKNCIEHTPKKGEIKISLLNNALYTEILIKDDGKGIAKEDLPYLFQRFYKGKHASEESVGIGLAMAHQVIAKQGGDIEVSSEIGEGTQFRIKFYH